MNGPLDESVKEAVLWLVNDMGNLGSALEEKHEQVKILMGTVNSLRERMGLEEISIEDINDETTENARREHKAPSWIVGKDTKYMKYNCALCNRKYYVYEGDTKYEVCIRCKMEKQGSYRVLL